MVISTLLKDIAKAIRFKKYEKEEDSEILDNEKIIAKKIVNEIFTISDNYFTKNMCDGYGNGLRSIVNIIVDCSIVHSFNASAFNGITSLASVTFDLSNNGYFTSIGNNAFYKCSNLQSIIFPEGLTSIGTEAFYSCNLKDIDIPSTLTSVPEGAFYGNPIATIQVHDDNPIYTSKGSDGKENNMIVEKETNKLILGSSSTTDITGIEIIGRYAFYKNTVAITTIPASVTIIRNNAFMQTKKISLEFEKNSNLLTLGNSVFYQAPLQSIELPDSVTSIGTQCFSSTSIKTITIPPKVSVINAQSFQYCNSLTECYMPANVTTIQSNAFNNCPKLTLVDFSNFAGNEDNIPTLANTNAFSVTNSELVIKVPNNLVDVWKTKNNWAYYANKIQGA